MLKQPIFIFLILLFSSSCHSPRKTTTIKSQYTPINTLTNIRWKLFQPDNDEAVSSSNQNKIHLILNSSDKSITGFSGCNLFYGFYSVENENRVSFSRISTSNLSCADEELNEEQFLQKLETTTHFRVDGETLTLKNETGKLIQFTKGVNYPNSIEEKHWKMKTMNGKTIKMSEDQEREIFFRLKSDENIAVGFSGCNHFQGTYSLEEQSKIRFNAMSSTKKACPNLHINEGEVFKIFELVDNYILVDDLLLFRTKDNRHLAEFEAIYFN